MLGLIRRHMVILLVTPLLIAGLVIFLTKNPNYTFSSEATLYTGIASGSSVEMDKSLSYFATNTAFDNLINIINSRQTQQEVAVRLLAQHLMLENYDSRIISSNSFEYLKKITPQYVYALIDKKTSSSVFIHNQKSLKIDTIKSSVKIDSTKRTYTNFKTSYQNIKTGTTLIDSAAFEQTVKKLTDLLSSSDTNFVYKLLNYDSPHYSIHEISDINVYRINSSDIVRLNYTSDDPGICQQTLVFYINVCIKNYRKMRENNSDAVIKYFEFQVEQATQKLKDGEEKLLAFNKGNNIINYYEQSKAVAVAKEELDVDYNNMRIKLAGTGAAIQRLEEKLENQQKIQLKSAPILEMRNELSLINTRIASAETMGAVNSIDNQSLASLKVKAEKIKNEMREAVEDLYKFQNTTEGLPIASLLNEWIANVVSYEDTKAGMEVLSNRIQEFQKQYEIYAPAGANLKRIEREITVSEQEYLELLHGLNLAKLKMQDTEISSNLNIIDHPFYPLTPNPTKRKILILAAALFGFVMVAFLILVLEYFDNTLKNPQKAAKKIKLLPFGIFPKIYLKPQFNHFPTIVQRLLEISGQRIEVLKKEKIGLDRPYQILFFSTSDKEGKTVLAQNLASQLTKLGNEVIVLNYRNKDIQSNYSNQFSSLGALLTTSDRRQKQNKINGWINLILGYPDTQIDDESAFLKQQKTEDTQLHQFDYVINEKFSKTQSYKDLLAGDDNLLAINPDYVLIEIPSILYYSYPSTLIASVDLPLLVCRANRVWAQADKGSIDNITKMTSYPPQFILNGIEADVVESVLGKLPKRGRLTRRAK